MANARWNATVSALQAETGMTNGEVALLAGYNTPGDGGGGLLWFNTAVPTAKTVTNATNATPIVITTSAAHGLTTGNRVMIAGVVGNNAANGTRVVTVLSATTFSLNGTTGNGTYVSGGVIGDGGTTIPSSAAVGIWTRLT